MGTETYFARQDEINGGHKVPHSNRGLEELLESSEPALEEQLGDRTIRSQHLLTSYSLGTWFPDFIMFLYLVFPL